MEAWLSTFRNGVFVLLEPEDRARAVEERLALLRPALSDADGNWTADYVRLWFAEVRGRGVQYEVIDPHDHTSLSHPLRGKVIMGHPS
jgi:hypothetical protein